MEDDRSKKKKRSRTRKEKKHSSFLASKTGAHFQSKLQQMDALLANYGSSSDDEKEIPTAEGEDGAS